MALRHNITVGEMDVGGPKLELRVPPMMRSPASVKFRRGTPMKEVVDQISGEVSSKLQATFAAGKSTVVPKEIAMQLGVVVFHITGNALLGRDIYNHLTKLSNEDSASYPPLALCTGTFDNIPKIGVYFIGAADFVMMMLSRSLTDFKSCVVFLDEAHESDAYSYVIRTLCVSEGAGCFVQASATFDPSGFAAMESGGFLERRTYPATCQPESWDVHDRGKPWYYASCDNNLLVYIDSRSGMDKLADQYQSVGFVVHRLVSGMSALDFDDAMRDLRNKKGPLVVLLADYTFRSGFTFPVGKIIDTGMVSFYDSTPGVLAKCRRQAFTFEMEQAAARGGRTSGLRTVVYSPDLDYQDVICELEGVEAEAAAYLYRLLGYKPVRDLSDAVMAVYDLPSTVTVRQALNGPYPMSYLVVGPGSVPRSGTPIPVEPVLVQDDGMASPEQAPVTPKLHLDDQVLLDSDLTDSAFEFNATLEHSDTWAKLMSVLGKQAAVVPEVGDLIELPGVESIVPSALFPRGLDSAIDFMSTSNAKLRVAGLAQRDKLSLMSLLVERYNFCAVEVLAGGQALLSYADRVVSSGLAPEVKDVFVKVLEAVTSCDAEQVGLYTHICVLIDQGVRVSDMDGAMKLVAGRYNQLIDQLDKLLASATSGSAMRKALEMRLKDDGLRVAECLPIHGYVPMLTVGYDCGYMASVSVEHRSHRRRRKSRHSSRTLEVGSSAASLARVDMPSWTGCEYVEYELDSTGSASSAVFRPGGFLRRLTGRDSFGFH